MAKVLALVDNFLFKVRISETAKQYGIVVDFWDKGLLEGYELIIVDANARETRALEVLRQLRVDKRKNVVCYLNHIQVELAKEIRSLGVDRVWPQSLFVKKLPEMLSELSKK